MLWVTRLFKKTHLKQVVFFFFDTMIYGKRDFFVFHHDIVSLTPQQKASALLNLRYLMRYFLPVC